jgi:hypothetical protein
LRWRGIRRFETNWPFLFQAPSVLSSSKSVSEKDSDPTLQRHSGAMAGGPCQKSAFVKPINYKGRRPSIPEECEIPQKTEIAPLQIALHPGTRQR